MTPSDDRPDRQTVLDILNQAETRLTARDYITAIRQRLSVSARQAKQIIQNLVDKQELAYHYLYGNTYIEKSFLRPVRVTPHFTLTPPGFNQRQKRDQTHILLNQGISFGSGQHPTTRLCLEAIDTCIFKNNLPETGSESIGADIGTGSGVLAIAMCLSGISECRAWEIDPVSLNEAKTNAAMNKLEKRIRISDTYFAEERSAYDMICANLRWPTLKSLKDSLFSSLKPGAPLILSGVREWEKKNLIRLYSQTGFETAWQKDEKEWSGFLLIKKPC